MTHPDSYRSVNIAPAHRFIVILYGAGTPIRVMHVEADCYADAVEQAAPGNDMVKIEVIAAG